jgi:hypothetical protein
LNLLYLGVGLLVLAQLIGIYGLVTKKADLILSLLVGIVVAGVAIGGLGVYRQLF